MSLKVFFLLDLLMNVLCRFMKHVERTLLARPTEANLGGVPSVQNKIRAYITVKYSKMGQWTSTNLELANNQPIWARIYLLLRAGYPDEALAFAKENEQHLQKLEKGFLSYFKAWIDSTDKR
jgi:nuclear pore complex protein Nup93